MDCRIEHMGTNSEVTTRNLIDMKKIFYIIALFIICSTTACKDMDSLYEQYIVPNGITYPGKALEPMVFAGHLRVKMQWVKSADPSLAYAQVFWNNYTDSIRVDIPKDGDTVTCFLSPLEENSYSFMIHTYDDKGNVSIPVEVIGTVYGEGYIEMLSNRSIKRTETNEHSELIIQWGLADIANGAFATEVKFANATGDMLEYRDWIDSNEGRFAGYEAGSEYFVRTLFLPDSLSVDTFYTDYERYEGVMLSK